MGYQKKTSIIILILCILMSNTFSIFAMADITGHRYEEPIRALVSLEILKGRGENTFAPDYFLTRAEAAKVAGMLLGFTEEDANKARNRAIFADVSEEITRHNWAVGWINIIANEGIIVGDGTGNYNPSDALSLNQWITIVVRILGYENYEMKNDWPTAYINKANQLNLLKNISTNRDIELVTRGEMAELAYRTVQGGAQEIITKVISDSEKRINPTDLHKHVIRGIGIGDLETELTSRLGKPARIDESKYGFKWYIYNQDYANYLQVGVKSGKVVALYTNADNWEFLNNVKIGTSKNAVESVYGKPLSYIQRGNTRYRLDHCDEFGMFLYEEKYITIFYDVFNNNTVTAVKIIDKEVEQNLAGFYGNMGRTVEKSFEKQIFDLANSIRYRFGKPILKWTDEGAEVAKLHSKDMSINNFFSHKNKDRESPHERLIEDGRRIVASAENIAAGQTSAIFAHEAWMNSKDHRDAMLSNLDYLGVGVYVGGQFRIYYTQMFYSLRN
ncbi:MAG: CAP-associated domain-containing protein [Alkaliphilus sp.]